MLFAEEMNWLSSLPPLPRPGDSRLGFNPRAWLQNAELLGNNIGAQQAHCSFTYCPKGLQSCNLHRTKRSNFFPILFIPGGVTRVTGAGAAGHTPAVAGGWRERKKKRKIKKGDFMEEVFVDFKGMFGIAL